MFKKFISRFTSGVKGGSVHVEYSSAGKTLVHWKVLLTTFFVMTLLVIVTSFFTRQDILNGEFSSVTNPVLPSAGQVTLEHLEKLVKHFETKSVTFEQVRKNRVSTSDPSR